MQHDHSRNPCERLHTYHFMWGSSDESLLAGLAAGDRSAAAAFVRRFQGRVYGLALTIVGDPQVAEDVAQEAFVRAWRHAAAYDARRGRVSTWLLAITRNHAIDVTRLRGWTTVDPDVIAAELTRGGHGPDPAEGAAPDEGARLRAALAALPEEHRRALVLAACFGRTAQEISELEGAPLGTIKTRIRTAMLRMREGLEVAD